MHGQQNIKIGIAHLIVRQSCEKVQVSWSFRALNCDGPTELGLGIASLTVLLSSG